MAPHVDQFFVTYIDTTRFLLVFVFALAMPWVGWNLFVAVNDVRVMWHRLRAARRAKREQAGYLIITGTPVRRRRALRCSAR